jgi:hypothetical protein
MKVDVGSSLVKAIFEDWARLWRDTHGPATTKKPTPRGKYCLRFWKRNMQILVVPREKGTLVALIMNGQQVDKFVVYNVAPKTLRSDTARLYVVQKINNQIRSFHDRAEKIWEKEDTDGNVLQLRETEQSPA